MTKDIDVGICGDAKLTAQELIGQLSAMKPACLGNAGQRLERANEARDQWEAELSGMSVSDGEVMAPRHALRELEKAMPKVGHSKMFNGIDEQSLVVIFQDAMVSTDIGNICSVSNSYLRFDKPRSFFAAMSFGNCGYAFPCAMGAKLAAPERPSIAYVGKS